jgi:hypothetical protein
LTREIEALGGEVVDVNVLDPAVARLGVMFWRFLAATTTEGNDRHRDDGVFVIWDVDSVLTTREHVAITQWLSSPHDYVLFRDHYKHCRYPVLGGMWGGKRALPLLRSQMLEFGARAEYMADMIFLQRSIWYRHPSLLATLAHNLTPTSTLATLSFQARDPPVARRVRRLLVHLLARLSPFPRATPAP